MAVFVDYSQHLFADLSRIALAVAYFWGNQGFAQSNLGTILGTTIPTLSEAASIKTERSRIEMTMRLF